MPLITGQLLILLYCSHNVSGINAIIISSMSYITEINMDQFVLQTTVDISLFRVPDIVVHHPKHELHQRSQHGSVCI